MKGESGRSSNRFFNELGEVDMLVMKLMFYECDIRLCSSR